MVRWSPKRPGLPGERARDLGGEDRAAPTPPERGRGAEIPPRQAGRGETREEGGAASAPFSGVGGAGSSLSEPGVSTDSRACTPHSSGGSTAPAGGSSDVAGTVEGRAAATSSSGAGEEMPAGRWARGLPPVRAASRAVWPTVGTAELSGGEGFVPAVPGPPARGGCRSAGASGGTVKASGTAHMASTALASRPTSSVETGAGTGDGPLPASAGGEPAPPRAPWFQPLSEQQWPRCGGGTSPRLQQRERPRSAGRRDTSPQPCRTWTRPRSAWLCFSHESTVQRRIPCYQPLPQTKGALPVPPLPH